MAESNQNGDILVELKSSVLNLDWEISDATVEELSQAVAKLQAEWVGQKVLLVYLQILGALCQYIGASRENAHPGSFTLLKEVFDGLETVCLDPEMDQVEQNTSVMGFAGRYNDLKKDIAAGNFKPAAAAVAEVAEEEDDSSADETVFDSMLNTMVSDSDGSELETEDAESEVDDEPEPEVTPTPPARPAVQASFNKADGTEVESDRNEDDVFAEADELLDDFFDDDVPAPGAGPIVDDSEIFDLDESMDDHGGEEPSESRSDDDDIDLVIDLDEDAEAHDDDDSFQEMEDTLDDFFGEEEEDDLLDEVTDKVEADSLIDEALDDFFDDEDVPTGVENEELKVEESDKVADDSQVEEVLVLDDGLDDEESVEEDDLESEVVADELAEASDTEPEVVVEELAEADDTEPEVAVEELAEADVTEPEVAVDELAEADGTEPEVVVDELAKADDIEPEGAAEEQDSFEDLELTMDTEEGVASDLKPALVIPVDETATEFVTEDGDLDADDAEDNVKVDVGEDSDKLVEEAETDIDAGSIENLQMLLLSVEWEVDDKLLHHLQDEVDSLKVLLKENTSACIHLSFLDTVIRYIVREQADMISNSMTCLKLIVDSLESLMQDQAGDVSSYGEGATRSFVDWHELVVLDFEKRLAMAAEVSAESPELVEDNVTETDSESPALSAEMVEMKELILKEVRELIAQELAGLKG